MQRLPCFKTYDVRGRVPSELNPELAFRLGQAFAEVVKPDRVAVGRDMRLSSPELAAAVADGLRSQDVSVFDLGLCGTEEVYFATFARGLGGGIMVTASHNPADYNGMKLVGPMARPIDSDQLGRMESLVRESRQPLVLKGGTQPLDCRDEYLDLMCGIVSPDAIRGLKILGNAGNGSIGPLLKRLQERYQFDMEVIQGEPDGTFPHGVPNPLLPENRGLTSEAVKKAQANLGVAWEGDFDRCFFFDEQGEFVESYYLIALFAAHFLRLQPGGTILYDPRLTWSTEELVTELGGRPTICRTGHVFFKQALRDLGGVYGGEMSGHHYFSNFGCCDTGVVPWLLLMSRLAEGEPLGALVAERRARYPISGEINRKVEDQPAALARVRARFAGQAERESSLDGVSMEFPEWRFNLRSSNTEPLIRLNVESRGLPDLVAEKVDEILSLVDG